jgi:FtsH-binding integral membrane protein
VRVHSREIFPVRTAMMILRLGYRTASAMLYAVSIGVALAVLASAYTSRLAPALVAALAGMLLAMTGFGYVIWRSYRRGLAPSF